MSPITKKPARMFAWGNVPYARRNDTPSTAIVATPGVSARSAMVSPKNQSPTLF
ncbi:MAG: hypothetical protein Q8P88_01375 [Candidatus Jorgensenbacteria bacterium]|nr:hypothetical protein [Candidatus Jorgensenbacteria bacterium]